MKALFTLKSQESKRLLGKAVSQLDEVKHALSCGKIAIAGGTTNGYVLEELTEDSISKAQYTAGVITDGVHCVVNPKDRLDFCVLENGEKTAKDPVSVTKEFTKDDVFIKGANAVDHNYYAGVLMGSDVGGTMNAFPTLQARGSNLIVPVGLEKMVPSVLEASSNLGIQDIDLRLGMACGMFPLTDAKVITEIQAFEILTGGEAIHAASGGVGGSEGSVTILLQGSEAQVTKGFDIVKQLKKEKPVAGLKRSCSDCQSKCELGMGNL